jgi:large subunit ribosomal protein L9
MKVFLLQDVKQVGHAGQMLSVADGFAYNFLLPRKLAVEITPANERSFAKRVRVVDKEVGEVVDSRSSLVAEKIKGLNIILKRKVHDEDKLYGAVTSADIAELLGERGVSVQKNQVIIDKAIKKTGAYSITIKLSSRLQPTLALKVVPE